MSRHCIRNQRPGTRRTAIAVALVLAASLAGCGPADTGLQRDAAHQLQEHVLVVSKAAAGSDHAAALKGLAELEAEVMSASGNGQISEQRRRRIMTSVAAVRADITAAIEAAAVAAKAAAAAKTAAAEKAKAESEAAAKAAQETTAPVIVVPPPAPVTAPGQGKGKQGKGQSKNE